MTGQARPGTRILDDSGNLDYMMEFTRDFEATLKTRIEALPRDYNLVGFKTI